jgi:hypothetical protein
VRGFLLAGWVFAAEPVLPTAVPVALRAAVDARVLVVAAFAVLAVPDFGRDAARAVPGLRLAADIVLAAAVSALAAAVSALVAVFIERIAADIVLADELALVTAVVIRPAAEVTFDAAADTVRAAEAGVVPCFAAARLTLLVLRVASLAFALYAAGLVLLAVRAVLAREICLLCAAPAGRLFRAPPEAPRIAVRVAVCAGTDLPPS